MALHQTCSDNRMERWRQLHDKSRPHIMSTPGLAVPVNQPISWAFLISAADSVNRCFGNGTYTVWVSSCGLSACSGNTGCGGSPMGTQPSDLLIAWLSFLAGDFCEEGGTNKASVTSWVVSAKHFKADCHNRVRCLSPLWLLCFISYYRQLWWCLTEWRPQWGKYIILHEHSWKHVTAQFVVQRRGMHASDYQMWHSFNHVKFEGLNSPEFNSWPDNQDIFSFNTSLKHKLMNILWVRCSVMLSVACAVILEEIKNSVGSNTRILMETSLWTLWKVQGLLKVMATVQAAICTR